MSNNQTKAKEYLTACFQSKGFEPFFIVSKTALLRILDVMGSQTFDRDLANELFEHIPTNYKGLVKIEDFIDLVIQADIALNEKINKANHFLKNQIEEQSRIQNKNRQMVLQVRVIGGRNLYQGQVNVMHKPYVIVHFNQEKRSSNLAHNDIYNPIWDETFVFQVQSGNEQSFISILDMDTTSKKSNLIGEVHFGLRELEDQMKHNQWFNLYDRNGQMIPGSLQLELQLFLNENEFCAQTQEVMNQQILSQQEEKEQYEKDLKNLYQPFQINSIQPKKLIIPDAPQLMFVNELSKPIVYQGDKKVDLTIYKTPQLSDSRVLQILNLPPESVTTVRPENEYPAKFDLKQKANYGYDHITKDMKITAFLIFLFLLCSIYLCWIKTDFVNITLALLTALIVGLNYFEKNHLNLFAVLLILSLLYDVSWLAAYSGVRLFFKQAWWDQNKSENPQVAQELITSERITIIDCYIVIILKIALSCQLWNLKQNIGLLNDHKQFGIGTHLYQAQGGHINPFIQQQI